MHPVCTRMCDKMERNIKATDKNSEKIFLSQLIIFYSNPRTLGSLVLLEITFPRTHNLPRRCLDVQTDNIFFQSE